MNQEELLAAGLRAAGKGQCKSVLVAPDHTGADNYHNCSGGAASHGLAPHYCGCGYEWISEGVITRRPE